MTPLVRGLGYIRLQTTSLEQWRAVALDGLGFSEARRREPDALRLKMDGREERLVVLPGATDETLAIGWEARDQFALHAVGRALQAHAVEVTDLTDQECHDRRVDGALRFIDPAGTPVEVFHGPVNDDVPMHTKYAQKFITGELGLGTVAIGAHDVDQLERFYAGVLGFQPRGAVQVRGAGANPGARPVRTRLLGVNARHHSLVLAPGGTRYGGLQKIRVEVDSLDAVGTANDEVLAQGGVEATTLGRHSNDRTLSFYCRMPGGLLLEYATESLTVNHESFVPEEFTRGTRWGHDWKTTQPTQPAHGSHDMHDSHSHDSHDTLDNVAHLPGRN